MQAILQKSIPYDIECQRPLPGVAPLDMADWLIVDSAFAAQMNERENLLNSRRAEVVAVTDRGRTAADELLNFVLDWLTKFAPGYGVSGAGMVRPDGVTIPLDRSDPMGTLGQLVQEDLCLLEKRGDEHVLTAAVLCFPASWRLSDKIDKPLTAIHGPVPEYDAPLARRVQRLFDGVREGRPLWRFNVLRYAEPDLFQPLSLEAPRTGASEGDYPFIRSERQCVVRLPETRACVFSIHSYVRQA